MERREEPEKVLVPVRHRETVQEEEELQEEPQEVKVPQLPRRWHTY